MAEISCKKFTIFVKDIQENEKEKNDLIFHIPWQNKEFFMEYLDHQNNSREVDLRLNCSDGWIMAHTIIFFANDISIFMFIPLDEIDAKEFTVHEMSKLLFLFYTGQVIINLEEKTKLSECLQKLNVINPCNEIRVKREEDYQIFKLSLDLLNIKILCYDNQTNESYFIKSNGDIIENNQNKNSTNSSGYNDDNDNEEMNLLNEHFKEKIQNRNLEDFENINTSPEDEAVRNLENIIKTDFDPDSDEVLIIEEIVKEQPQPKINTIEEIKEKLGSEYRNINVKSRAILEKAKDKMKKLNCRKKLGWTIDKENSKSNKIKGPLDYYFTRVNKG